MAGLVSAGDTSADSVEDAKEKLTSATVTAPISGTITAVSVNEGDTYTSGKLFTIEDCSTYEVSANIDEYDINKVKVGQEVVIKTNGTGDEELSGRVREIAPRAVVTSASGTSASGTGVSGLTSATSGDVSYEVTISIETPSEDLRLDMTAKLSIVLEKAENVLTVPYEAVQEDEDGDYYVEVVDRQISTTGEEGEAFPVSGEDQNTHRVPVQKGIESDYYTEIISDELTEGTEVLVPRSDSDSNDLFFMMSQRGPMGGM